MRRFIDYICSFFRHKDTVADYHHIEGTDYIDREEMYNEMRKNNHWR